MDSDSQPVDLIPDRLGGFASDERITQANLRCGNGLVRDADFEAGLFLALGHGRSPSAARAIAASSLAPCSPVMRPAAIDASTSAIKAARRRRPSAFRPRFNSRAFAARPRDMSAMPSVIELMALANVLSLQSRHRSLASAARSRERLWAAACASMVPKRSARRAVNPVNAIAGLQFKQWASEINVQCPVTTGRQMTRFRRRCRIIETYRHGSRDRRPMA